MRKHHAVSTEGEKKKMNKIDLKPCPFCGGEAEIYGNEVVVFVGCKECTCITEWNDDISAERGWNKRVGQDGEGE